MAYGLRIRNNANVIQIDGENPNYVRIQSGVVAVPGRSGATLGRATVDFPSQTTPTMVFVRPPYNTRIFGSDTPFTGEYFKNKFALFNTDAAADVEYAIFAVRSEQPDTPGWGLRIRDHLQRTIYTSNDIPPRIVGALEYAPDGATRDIWPAGGPGRLFFSIFGTGWWEISSSGSGAGSPFISQAMCAQLVSESQIRISNTSYPGSPGAREIGGVRMLLAARIH